MRIDPVKKEPANKKKPAFPIEVYTRKAALVFVFVGVYFFLIKILFL